MAYYIKSFRYKNRAIGRQKIFIKRNSKKVLTDLFRRCNIIGEQTNKHILARLARQDTTILWLQ